MKVNGQRDTSDCRNGRSEKHKSWSFPVEGFRDHVTTDCSLLGVSGKWSACGRSVVQLNHDEEMGPMHGMYGTLGAKLEVQRTIKSAKLTAFLCFLRKAISSTLVHVGNKGIIDGVWRGETQCIGPKAQDADLWIAIKMKPPSRERNH